jgi:hypothetical protein
MLAFLVPHPLGDVMRKYMNCRLVTQLECTSYVKFGITTVKFGLSAVVFQGDSSGLVAVHGIFMVPVSRSRWPEHGLKKILFG